MWDRLDRVEHSIYPVIPSSSNPPFVYRRPRREQFLDKVMYKCQSSSMPRHTVTIPSPLLVKSDSSRVRFVIARHSPALVLETGLLIEAPEKNPCNEGEVARASFSLVRVWRDNTAKVRPFLMPVVLSCRTYSYEFPCC
jgi:hypothetical protein